MLSDGYREQGMRAQLVQLLAQKGITNTAVLNAIGKVPRHFFLDSAFIDFAYADKAFPIGVGQTISQPFTVALQTQLLDVHKNEKVLEIGTGSGYQTSVLIEMGAKVFTIERQRELYNKASQLLPQMGYHPHFFYGDGYLGKPTYGPFDKILVTAGAPSIPEKLLTQLKIGGIMVIPIGEQQQRMIRICRTTESEFTQEDFGNCAFVPMLEGKN
mgnify:CR=1 FL=1